MACGRSLEEQTDASEEAVHADASGKEDEHDEDVQTASKDKNPSFYAKEEDTKIQEVCGELEDEDENDTSEEPHLHDDTRAVPLFLVPNDCHPSLPENLSER